MKGDVLTTLPTDKTQLTYNEKMMMDALFPPADVKEIEQVIENFPTKKIWVSFKEIILATVLFVVLNLPQVDRLIASFFRTENVYYRLSIKTAIFSILFFVLSNVSLARS
jgi:heme A synthase